VTRDHELVVEHHEGVLVISIDRPAVRNAISREIAQAIGEALDAFEADASLHAAILHGRHGVFSSGMDLARFRETGERPLHPDRGSGGITGRPPLKPLIAAVEGWALGLGFEILLACDLVIAANDARFGLPEVRHGLIAAGGGAIRLPSRVPWTIAAQILLTGRPIAAERLYQVGLINELCAPGHALEAALRIAGEMGQADPAAVAATKDLMLRSLDWSVGEAFGAQAPFIDAMIGRNEETS